jgi:hypothetical protein
MEAGRVVADKKTLLDVALISCPSMKADFG